ncbi:MAG: signal peptide peptidase SppA [Bacteroidia bacterium]
MKKVLTHLLTFVLGIFLGLGVLIGILLIAANSLGEFEDTYDLKNNSVLTISLGASLPEQGSEDPFQELTRKITNQPNPIGLNQFRLALNNAETNPKIKGILIDPGNFAGGVAHASEIRNSINKFKKSGKWVYAYSNNYSEQGIYIASACDSVFANPQGIIEFNGISSGIIMYKGLLDELGIKVQVFKVGTHKGAVEPFVQKELSQENRSQILNYLKEIYKVQVKEMAEDKNIDFEVLWNSAISQSVVNVREAKKYGLIHNSIYRDVLERNIEKKVNNPVFVNVSNFLKVESNYRYKENRIAVLYMDGDIVPGNSKDEGQISGDYYAELIRKIRNDKKIKALVIRVNSPGGSSQASDIIAREIEITKKKIPVIASYGNVAASGGYYISCLADSNFALPNSITGSIGVFALIPNTTDFFNKYTHLNYENVGIGDHAELWRPDQPLNQFQAKVMQNTVNQIYLEFKKTVSRGRSLSMEDVEKLAQGKVYSGVTAKEIGLIDDFGNIERAIKSASIKAKTDNYRLVEYPKSQSPIQELLNGGIETYMKSNSSILKSLEKTQKDLNSIQGIQMRLPWSTEIH